MNNKLFAILVVVFFVAAASAGNFPVYFEIGVGETVSLDGFPPIKLVDKKVTFWDENLKRIGAAQVTVLVGKEKVVVPIGYENDDVVVGNVRLGAEVISDYEKEFGNARFHPDKDVRLRIAKVGEDLMPGGVYPFSEPWGSGTRNQGWLTVCTNIQSIESGKFTQQRYHDGYDFGAWEGQLIRSVCKGTVVLASKYPQLLVKRIISNRNGGAVVGGNPFLVKHAELPVLFYYTHLSGLAKDFKDGDTIEAGEIIGYASARGASGGWYHLHFSTILIDQQIHVNPFPFLKEWYKKSLPHYMDFLSNFDVYHFKGESGKRTEFEQSVVASKVKPTGKFHNSLPGVVQLREAVAAAPFSGMNHAISGQFAILKGKFDCPEDMNGELWLGHTGKTRVYLNGEQVYSGENKNPYHRSARTIQTDSQMVKCQFKKGVNEVMAAVEQTNVFWSFSIRPRTKLGLPLK